jgi:hypothetical protein
MHLLRRRGGTIQVSARIFWAGLALRAQRTLCQFLGLIQLMRRLSDAGA